MDRIKKFTIDGRQFTVQFPNVGQIIDLDAMRQALSSNRYGAMAASCVKSSYYALDLIDAISFFQVVCPEVGRYFDIQNFATIDLVLAEKLLKPWREEIKPWYENTMDEIRGVAQKSVEDGNNSKGDE